jgi:alpha-L-arabinofuranosidase
MNANSTIEKWSIAAHSPQSDISTLLFGHNLEHTRSSMWQGLSAQLVRNRKFAGKPHRTGQALEWYRIGQERNLFMLDITDTYTRHVRDDDGQVRRRNELNSQKIQNYAANETCGLGQRDIPLAEQGYEFRIVLKASSSISVNIRFTNDGRTHEYTSHRVEAVSNEWTAYSFSFEGPVQDESARLEITFDQTAELAIGAVSLLPDNHFHGMRPDVIRDLKQMGTTMLRWPGGNFAGDYRWEDGLLEADQRGPLGSFTEVETFPHTFGFDYHEVGIDEFIALCREVRAEPFISINLTWDTPEQSGAWVEYCNGSADTKWGRIRAERGFPDSYNVKYWSLGNELGYGHMEGANTPKGYAERAATFAKALRKVDDSLLLVSSGIWWDDAWFTDCLAQLAPEVDAISEHMYATDKLKGRTLPFFDPEQAKEYFSSLVQVANDQVDTLRKIRHKIDAVVPAGKRVSISFDEWNVWYAWYRNPGVTEGIYAASVLHLLCREAAQLDVAFSCYFEPINEGAILVNPFASRLTPVGQTFGILRAHGGNQIVQAVAESADGATDVTASVNAETGELIVSVINRSPDQAAAVNLRLSNGSDYSLAGATLLSSGDFLPGSIFDSGELQIDAGQDGQTSFTMPKHSIAMLRFCAAK